MRHFLLGLCLAIAINTISCSDSHPGSPSIQKGYRSVLESKISEAESMVGNPQSHTDGLKRLARLYHANGDFSKALPIYQKLSQIEPQNPIWPHSMASVLAGYGQLEKAIPLQARASELAPKEQHPRLRLAEMHLKLNESEKAKALYQSALDLDPKSVYALLGLARCDLRDQNLESARSRLEVAVSIDPAFTGGWSLLSSVLEQVGQTELSEIARQKSFGRYVDFPDPWLEDLWEDCFDPYQLSVAAAVSTNQQESIKLLSRAITLDPENSSYHRQLGNIYLKASNLSLAREQFEQATTNDPQDAESWSSLVHLLMQSNDYQSMSEAMETALTHCPNSAYLHFMNGKRFAMIGVYENALNEFEVAKRIQPHEGRSYVQIAMIMMMQGKLEQATREAKLAIDREPSNPDSYVILVKTAILTGKRSQARYWFNKLLEIPNRSPEDEQLLRNSFQNTFRTQLN